MIQTIIIIIKLIAGNLIFTAMVAQFGLSVLFFLERRQIHPHFEMCILTLNYDLHLPTFLDISIHEKKLHKKLNYSGIFTFC